MAFLSNHSKVAVLEASPFSASVNKSTCADQLATVHPLYDSESNFAQRQFDMSMCMLRNHEGLGPPLRCTMDLFAARQIGRLPFLESSHLMENVLLGNDERIEYSDIFNMENENMRNPHVVVERSLGI